MHFLRIALMSHEQKRAVLIPFQLSVSAGRILLHEEEGRRCDEKIVDKLRHFLFSIFSSPDLLVFLGVGGQMVTFSFGIIAAFSSACKLGNELMKREIAERRLL